MRLDPKFGEARLKLAETYERMGNLRQRSRSSSAPLMLCPTADDAQIKATEILLLAGRLRRRQGACDGFAGHASKMSDALILRANAMAALKDAAGAMAEIEEALKVQAQREQRCWCSLARFACRPATPARPRPRFGRR